MGTKLKKIVLLIISILIFTYISFPFWSVSIIKHNLPLNWKVVTLDVGYPGISGLEVANIEIQSDQVNYYFTAINIDYNFTTINVKSARLDINTSSNKQAEHKSNYSLPKFPLDKLLNQLSNTIKNKLHLSIEELELLHESNQYNLSGLGINIKNNGSGDLSFNLDPNQYLQKKKRIESTFSLTADNFFSKLQIENQPTFDLFYANSQGTTKLKLSIDMTSINEIEPIKAILEQVNTNVDGQLQFDFQQDESKQLISKINYYGNIYSLVDNNAPISLKLSSQSNSVDFPFDLQTSIQISSDFFSLDNFDIEGSKVNFNTLIAIEEEDYKFSSSLIETNINSIRLSEKLLSFEQVQVISQIEDFSLKQLSLSDLRISNDISNMDFSYQAAAAQAPIKGKASGKVELSGIIDSHGSGQLTLYPISIPEIGISEFAEIKIKLEDVDTLFSKGSITINAEDYDGLINPLVYNKILADIKLNFAQDLITGDGNIQINEFEVIPLEFTFDKNRINFDIELLQKNIELALINQLMKKLPDELPLVSLVEGSLRHQGKLKYNNSVLAISADNTIELSNAELAFDDNKAFNINSKSYLKSITPIEIESVLNVEKVELISGLDIESISSRLVLSDINFDILDLEMKLLSGTILSDRIHFVNSELKSSLVSAEKISLTELIFFTKVESLFATGDLDFNIPLDTRDNAVVVENGSFTALSKGIIKYSSGSPITMEENIALFALQNFHYEKMDGTFSYNDKSGSYLLKIRLIGSNPELYDGYPIDFTFNIDGNLPGIFKSLFLSGSFEEAIMKSVKSQRKL